MFTHKISTSHLRICSVRVFYSLHIVSCMLVLCYIMSLSGVGQKDYIVLSARVHPGESNSSWIMRGMTMQ